MVRAWALVILLVLLLPIFVFAATDQAAPDVTKQIQDLLAAQGANIIGSYTVTKADLDKARADLLVDYRAYSDEQFMALDQRIQQFFVQFRQKIIISLLGVNALVAGIIFYYLNRINKGLSYESVALRRRKDEEERQTVVYSMNFIRERLQQIESQSAQMYETYVIPMHKFLETQQNQIDEHQRFIDEQQNGWQGEDQQDGQGYGQQGYGSGYSGEGSYGGPESSEYGAGTYEAGFPVEGTQASD